VVEKFFGQSKLSRVKVGEAMAEEELEAFVEKKQNFEKISKVAKKTKHN
jgi:hypothetical protein